MKELSILFVDDEEYIVKYAKELFKDMNYNVSFQMSSKEALEIFCSNPQSFDLVISDYKMPVLNGDQLVIKLRDIRSNIPVILCTACKNISAEIIQKCGINELIIKPYTSEEILSAIQRTTS